MFFVDGSGFVFVGSVFFFLFIMVVCGMISGFYVLISLGMIFKMFVKESDVRLVGYGFMVMESVVVFMVLVCVGILYLGFYFVINLLEVSIGKDIVDVVLVISLWGFNISVEEICEMIKNIGESFILSCIGGAFIFVIGLVMIVYYILGDLSVMVFWYYFVILFEVLFILIVVDVGI